MFPRSLNLSKSNSFFLFGARGTGKTTLLQNYFSQSDCLFVDLLDGEYLRLLQSNPEKLKGIVEKAQKQWCIIDEVQKVPAVLDVVHSLIEKTGQKFVLTGSSARKLKRGAANLLAGRAFVFKLFPLTHFELGDQFDLEKVLSYGSLPKVINLSSNSDKIRFLNAYTETYLKEEILIEQIIRNLPPFRRFLEVAARQDTEVVNYSNIARDILVDPKIVSNFYSIMEDTLLGFFLHPFHHSFRKRQKKAPKFYLFDIGVRRALAGTIDSQVTPKSYEFGSVFENFIINEVYRLLTYSEKKFSLSFMREDNDHEIDLIIERNGMKTCLVEIKSTELVHESHIKGLQYFKKFFPDAICYVLSRDPIAKIIDDVHCVPWEQGLSEILLKSTK